MNLSRQNFISKDFSGQDLSGQDLSHSNFFCCNFNNTNLSKANCSYCDFTGASLVGTNCNSTDFSHTCLACTFHPSDAFGITWTMECRTFQGMNVSKLMWFCYLHFAMLMIPEKEKDIDFRDKIKLHVYGAERYLRLKKLFLNREI